MKVHIAMKLIIFFLGAFAFTSCLEGDEMNTPPDGAFPIIQMTYNPQGGPLVNSGLRYFGASALLYPPTDEVDTATFAVTIQGKYDKPVTVTLGSPADALDDYYSVDSTMYQMMPDSTYDFINTSAVIEPGQNYAEFQVKFYPSKIDFTQDLMLPVTATNDANLPVSSNYGFVYFHVIGNIYAGAYASTYTLSRPNTADVTLTEDPKILQALNKKLLLQQAAKGVFNNPGITFIFSVNPDNTVKIETDPNADVSISATGGKTSTYDPATKTFHLYYEYVNAAGDYRKFDEVLVRK